LKILAVVLARGGSKRLPGKNMRTLGSKPLLLWSIDAAKGISEIVEILVSTDDSAIAEAARNAGAMVPWLRPAELATDTASSTDACIHALDWYETQVGNVDGVLLLQPTSPFRSRKSVLHGIELFRGNERRRVVGVSPAHSHPLWCFKIKDSKLSPYIDGADLHLRSQDLPAAYVINGAYYLVAPKDLRETRSFFNDDMEPLLMLEPEEGIDIDTEWDWKLAQMLLGTEAPGE
jgi:CMP-N,N'-diacetyllegionaminic acid synthase